MSYQHSFNLQVPPDQVWQAIQQVDRFQEWWGSLTELRLDGTGLEPGRTFTGVISPPLPYRMQVRLVVELAYGHPGSPVPCTAISRESPNLRLRPHAGGTRAAVTCTFERKQPAMRLAALVAYPVLSWGQDRIVETTVADFHRHLEEDGQRADD